MHRTVAVDEDAQPGPVQLPVASHHGQSLAGPSFAVCGFRFIAPPSFPPPSFSESASKSQGWPVDGHATMAGSTLALPRPPDLGGAHRRALSHCGAPPPLLRPAILLRSPCRHRARPFRRERARQRHRACHRSTRNPHAGLAIAPPVGPQNSARLLTSGSAAPAFDHEPLCGLCRPPPP